MKTFNKITLLAIFLVSMAALIPALAFADETSNGADESTKVQASAAFPTASQVYGPEAPKLATNTTVANQDEMLPVVEGLELEEANYVPMTEASFNISRSSHANIIEAQPLSDDATLILGVIAIGLTVFAAVMVVAELTIDAHKAPRMTRRIHKSAHSH